MILGLLALVLRTVVGPSLCHMAKMNSCQMSLAHRHCGMRRSCHLAQGRSDRILASVVSRKISAVVCFSRSNIQKNYQGAGFTGPTDGHCHDFVICGGGLGQRRGGEPRLIQQQTQPKMTNRNTNIHQGSGTSGDSSLQVFSRMINGSKHPPRRAIMFRGLGHGV